MRESEDHPSHPEKEGTVVLNNGGWEGPPYITTERAMEGTLPNQREDSYTVMGGGEPPFSPLPPPHAGDVQSSRHQRLFYQKN